MKKDLLKFILEIKDDLTNEIISQSREDYPNYDLHKVIDKITNRVNQELENE